MSSVLGKIQDAIVNRNNFGDYSVCGDDLCRAAAAALLLYAQSKDADLMMLEAENYREELSELYPFLGIEAKGK